MWSRRQIATGAAMMVAATPRWVVGKGNLRIVIVGGGIGGATAARYLAMSGAPVSVTLIEPQKHYTTGIFSNLYLAGARSLASLTHGYDELADRGIALRHERAAAIDPDLKRVHLESGDTIPYDRLVVSPGIAFESTAIEGYTTAATTLMPHAWTDGRQMELLRTQLEAMENGGTFVIAAPPAPYRCPRGPYERATMVAYYLKQFKPRSKILILDAEDDFIDSDLFQDAWKRHYPHMIEWRSGKAGWVGSVDSDTRTLRAGNETIKADVVNIIPPQVSGTLAKTAGLIDRTGWCPVDPESFGSMLHRNIYIVGDAARADDMPKTGFSANSQAKACAFGILSELSGHKRHVPHLLDAGFTFLAGDDAVAHVSAFTSIGSKLEGNRRSGDGLSGNSEVRRNTVRDANRWYDEFMHDVFG